MATANTAFHGTLTGGAATTVTLKQAEDAVTVINHGLTGIYFTVASDGATPTAATVGGNDTYEVDGVVGASATVACGAPPVTVSVISAGAVGFSVESALAQSVHER